jgi:hypothetical protein
MTDDSIIVATTAALAALLNGSAPNVSIAEKVVTAIEPLIRVRTTINVCSTLVQQVMELGVASEDGELVSYHDVLKIIEREMQ